MRLALIAIGVLSLSSLKVCESDEDKAPAAENSPAESSAAHGKAAAEGKVEGKLAGAIGLNQKARFGGHVAKVGEHLVELRVHKSGHVYAWLSDLEGKAVASPAKAKLKVELAAAGGARPALSLAYEEPLACFIGKADAGVKLEAAPVDVTLELDGKVDTAKLADVALLADAELGGNLLAVGNHSVELLVSPKGSVEAQVRTSAGAKLDGSADLDLKVKVPDVSGKAHLVALAWTPAQARFTGRVDGGVELVPGPIEVSLRGKAGAEFGAIERIALSVDASHGGRMVAVGDYSVELVALGDGLVAAWVSDASGKAHAAGDLDLNLKLAGPSVKLTWDAPSLSYRGKLGADVDLFAAPIAVSLKAKGRAHLAVLPALGAKARAKLKADLKSNLDAKAGAIGKLGADAKAKLDVKAPKIEVKAPSVKLNVERSANASAGTSTKSSAGGEAKTKAGAKAGFSIGTK